jgi:hypothetical protein
MSSYELSEWEKYFEIEGGGHEEPASEELTQEWRHKA